MGFQGADTEQLRTHRELLRTRAQSLSELRERLEPAVMDESIWRGPDAEAFRARWSSETASLFSEVTSGLGERSGELERHADEQDEASAGDGGGVSGGDGGGSGQQGGVPGRQGGPLRAQDEPSLWDRITDGLGVYNKLQGLFSKGKKVWDILSDIRTSTRFLEGAQDIFQVAAGTFLYGQKMTDAAFSAGKEFGGLAGKLLGKLGVPTGFGTTNFFGWVDDAARWAGDAMPFLSKAAPWVGKALPALDVGFGLHQMVDGINSGDTFSAVTGGANALGGGLMLAGGALSTTGVGAVVGGPLMAAGAIISGGAALADVGRMVYDNWDGITETASNVWNGAVEGASNAWNGLTEGAGNLWDGLTGAFG